MDKNFYDVIISDKLIKKYDRVILAVSGGRDSMYLFYNMIELSKLLNLKLVVCHFNHMVRKDATRDEDFVRKLCLKNNIEFHSKAYSMDEFAKENNISSEEAGRALRYSFFREVSKGDLILTAHNANDQAETLLFRIFRGTGISGLVGIKKLNNDLYRPMLSIARDKIDDYLQENNLEYVDDYTNFKPIYSRNKIRLEVIPYLKENFNENIIETINRLSENAKDESDFLESEIDRKYDDVYEDGYLVISKLKNNHKIIVLEIIKRYLNELFKNEELVNRKNLLNIYELLNKNSGTSLDIYKDIVVRVSYDKLICERKKTYKKLEKRVLKLGQNYTDYGKILITRGVKKFTNNFSISIDEDKIKGKLFIRNRMSGDKFKPLGMNGTKKLKDIFIDKKIDRNKRDLIPIICDEKSIIWIVGIGISEDYKIDNNTKNILNLEAVNVRY